MGTMVGHVGPGLGFFAIGLWHLINHIKLHSKNTNTYTSSPWFPSHFSKHLELYLIMLGSCTSIAMELFIGPANHQPLDPSDWTIPSDHLHNFEHASISLTFLLYAAFALAFDKSRPTAASYAMTQLLAAVAFGQQLLMFHLHSTDHMGVEGQYHWLLQLVIAVSLATTLMGIGYRRSFTVSFLRSVSILFQGVWLVVMGIMLWTPGLISKGCFMNMEDGHMVVRCHGDEALHRAKSLVNIQFSWYLAGVFGFSMWVYLFLSRRWSEPSEYIAIGKTTASSSSSSDDDDEDLESQKQKLQESQSYDDDDEEEDLESQKQKLQESQSFVHMGKGMKAMELER